MPGKLNLIPAGNPDFMIVSFAMMLNSSVLPIVSKIILRNGMMTDSFIMNVRVNKIVGFDISYLLNFPNVMLQSVAGNYYFFVRIQSGAILSLNM